MSSLSPPMESSSERSSFSPAEIDSSPLFSCFKIAIRTSTKESNSRSDLSKTSNKSARSESTRSLWPNISKMIVNCDLFFYSF